MVYKCEVKTANTNQDRVHRLEVQHVQAKIYYTQGNLQAPKPSTQYHLVKPYLGIEKQTDPAFNQLVNSWAGPFLQ